MWILMFLGMNFLFAIIIGGFIAGDAVGIAMLFVIFAFTITPLFFMILAKVFGIGIGVFSKYTKK